MEKHYESKYHGMEEDNWWFVARREMILNLLQRENKNSKILEVGCSGGPLIQLLNKNGFKNVCGIDISNEAIELCKKRGIEHVSVMDGAKPAFKNEKFDIIIASDVLEHINDDSSALRNWNMLLNQGGKLIVFVPAFMFLWSDHDLVNLHYRRYSGGTLSAVLKRAGFRVERISHWNLSLFFPAALVRCLQRILPKNAGKKKDQLFKLNSVVNSALTSLLAFEDILLKWVSFPFGVSVFAVAKKQ